MISSIVQKLNKSFGSPNSDASENSPNAKMPPMKSKKPCKLCKGAGCCILCDREDAWENMVYCTNKTHRVHLLHHSCDNLTPDMLKHIKDYFCPNCRADQYKVTFYKKTSTSKVKEISEILNLEKSIDSLNMSLENLEKNVKTSSLRTTKKPEKPPISNDCKDDRDVSKDDVDVSKDDVDVSKDDGDVTKDDEDVNKDDGDVSKVDGGVSKEDGDVSKDEENVSKAEGDVSNNILDASKHTFSRESLNNDSFLEKFPGQVPRHTPTSESDSDDSCNFSRTSTNILAFQEREQYLTSTISHLAKKLQEQNQEKNNLKNIIEGQENEIISLQALNTKFELELDEAGAVIAVTDSELKNTKKLLKIVEEQLTESKKPLPIDTNEMYSHPPIEVFELYKKEMNLSKTKTSQIKTLLGELNIYKKNYSDLKKENDDLRLKVVNLKEEDIDKKILNYTIEENRKLEYKIKIQKERQVRIGTEFKQELEFLEKIEEENKKLREKVQTLEKKPMMIPWYLLETC